MIGQTTPASAPDGGASAARGPARRALLPCAGALTGLWLAVGGCAASAPSRPPDLPEPVAPQATAADPDDDLPDEATAPHAYAGPQRGELAPSLATLAWYRGAPPPPGEPYVVFFWGTWCKPCKAAIPALVTQTTRRHLAVIAVSRDTPAALDAFFGTWSDRFPTRVAVDRPPYPVHRAYEAWTVPRFVYVDGTGHVVRVVYGTRALDSL